jgi:hypothetical protein
LEVVTTENKAAVSLGDCCDVVRSKNAGPFLITVDLMFSDHETYRRVLESGFLSREVVAATYGIPPAEILVFETLDALRAVKFTYRRRRSSGSPGESDCYGMNQEAPLLNIRFPAAVVAS